MNESVELTMKAGVFQLAEYGGPPQSAMWPGGALHLRAREGCRPSPEPHAHFAMQLTLGWPAATLSGACQASAWLIGSEHRHGVSACQVAVTLFLDPLTCDGRRLAARLAGRAAVALTEAECRLPRRELEECWQAGWVPTAAHSAATAIVNHLAPGASPPDLVDSRVRHVLDELMRNPDENTALAEMAEHAGLSESRLAHLFRHDVGLPMRQYRLSLRMERAVAQIARGATLTEAAHAAGFADSAHFCRTCRRMYGTSPSGLPDFKIEPAVRTPAR